MMLSSLLFLFQLLQAFVSHRPFKARQLAREKEDRAQRREHVPLENRETSTPPPLIVAVSGPKGSGKSTLIKSLVKKYTKQNLPEVVGPITVVISKTRRITLYEVPADLCSMMDVSKIVDLALLVIDAKFGFEMVSIYKWIARQGK